MPAQRQSIIARPLQELAYFLNGSSQKQEGKKRLIDEWHLHVVSEHMKECESIYKLQVRSGTLKDFLLEPSVSRSSTDV